MFIKGNLNGKGEWENTPKGTKAELAEIDTLMKKAVDLHRKEQLDAAVGIYRQVLEKTRLYTSYWYARDRPRSNASI